MSPVPTRVGLPLLAAISLLPGSVLGAQEPSPPATLDSLRLEARLDPGVPDVEVRLVYALDVPPGLPELPVGGLLMGATRLTAERARTPEGPARLVFDHGIGRRVEGSVLLPAAAGEDGRVELEIGYRVVGAVEASGGDVVVTLPVLSVGEGPADALPGTFRARVAVAPGLHVYEGFPTGLRREAAGRGEIVTLELQVVPSVVTLRARRGERAPLLPPLRLLDLGVLVLLGGLGALGLRALIREARP